MRKLFTNISILLILTMLLAGCVVEPVDSTTDQISEQTTDQATIPPVTDDEQTVPVENPPSTAIEDSTPETSPEPADTEETDSKLPYTQRIERFDQSIYQGPGYDYVFVGTVRERGAYTIVEEVEDGEGNLWGKLKSGIGWVDLTEIRSEDYANALISANYADENLLLHGAYHHCPGDDLEYAIPIAFRAYGKLRDVTLFGFEFSGDDYVPGEDFFTLSEMTEEMPLVAELVFPGDMSMYGIRFVDETGATHVYSIYISGRNSALILTEE